MNHQDKSYFKYWGKAKKRDDGTFDYHLLPYHCLDVAAVGQCLLAVDTPLTKDLADFLEVTPSQLQSLLVFLLALHDLGKFSSSFQQLNTSPDKPLLKIDFCYKYNGKNFRHDRIGYYFWKKIERILFSRLANIKDYNSWQNHVNFSKSLMALMILMDCMLGHHGQPIDKKDPDSIKPYTEEQNVIAVNEFVDDLFTIIPVDFPFDLLTSKQWQQKLKLVSWQIAGIAVLADWIGSDQSFFTYQSKPKKLADYWLHSQKIAKQVIHSTHLNTPFNVKPFQSIHKHFGYQPTPLQSWAETVPLDTSPQLFILEDVTGAGKTEAALALTHRLMANGIADGFYFGLPTMATSNAMFSRVAELYLQMLESYQGELPSIVLAHGARDMNELFNDAILNSALSNKLVEQNYDQTDNTATLQCNQWLADSRKKALLAPVGVGTIDQALLAVLPRRHQSLRLFGLNRKVLIFDEVHAADEYMFELLESLLALHLHQGGSAILLTATLALKQRQRLINTWLKETDKAFTNTTERAFPLASHISLNNVPPLHEKALTSRADVSREVKVIHLTSIASCIEIIIKALEQEQCVVWVRNSVDDAIFAYQRLSEKLTHDQQCILFHSRFVLADRKAIEDRVLDIFGKKGNKKTRAGKVLIATQVFQESLDADADLMISDICPIDDLIQRSGRLHRHIRDKLGVRQQSGTDSRDAPILYLHAPAFTDNPQEDWLVNDFRNTQYVYPSSGRLWLGLRKILQLGAIRMPEQARDLIEAVYSDEALAQIPQQLITQESNFFANNRSKAQQAKSLLLDWKKRGYSDDSASAWHEDITDISTRFSDREFVEVVLFRLNELDEISFWVNDERFAVSLSSVKLAKNKYADKLTPIPEKYQSQVEKLEKQYKQLQYMQLWLPQLDENYTYDNVTGFCERKTPLFKR